MRFQLSIGLLLLFNYCIAQNSHEKKFKINGIAGLGRSRFIITPDMNTENYPALELKIGGLIDRDLTQKLNIKSGLLIGLRKKTKSYLVNGNYYGKGILLLAVDNTSSKMNHVSIECPVYLNYNFQGQTKFAVGLLGRFWQPTHLAGDLLKSQNEIGLLLGISRKISTNSQIVFQYYSGFSKLGPIYAPSKYYVKNTFFQLLYEYTFNHTKSNL